MSLRHIDRLTADYAALHPELEAATDSYVELVRGIIDDAGINYLTVSGRAKGVASYTAKVRRVRAEHGDEADLSATITDLVGVRVITYVLSDVVAVAELLGEQLTVLDDRDMGQETAREGRFGYASRHLLVSLDPSVDGRPPAYDPRRCASVQIRTVLQHAWAEFEHDARYKGTIPPEQVPDLDRRFTLAAGLLELADREFGTIRDRLQAGLSGEAAGDDGSAGVGPRELATFLAGRYANAGWSRTEQYEWIEGILAELDLRTLDALYAALGEVDSAVVTRSMAYKYPPGAVRRLDDDLLAAFGERYLDLPGNARRREALAGRLARISELRS